MAYDGYRRGYVSFAHFLLYFFGSSSFLQVTRTTVKAWMSLNFGGILSLTAELAAFERLKKTYKLVSTLTPSFLFGSSSFLQVTRETI